MNLEDLSDLLVLIFAKASMFKTIRESLLTHIFEAIQSGKYG